MNHDEIEDRFIAAAKTEMRRRVEGVRPAEYGSSMPDYRHTQADVFGWGGKRFQEEREAFYRRLTNQVSAQDVTELHECERWAALIDDIALRRALWGWSRSKAGGETFKAWCARERITRETGRRRKTAAVEQIMLKVFGRTVQQWNDVAKPVLHDGPVSGDKSGTMATGDDGRRSFTWRDDPSLKRDGFVEVNGRRGRFYRDAKAKHMPEAHGPANDAGKQQRAG